MNKNRTTFEKARSAIVDRVLSTLNTIDGRFPFVADPDAGEWETTTDGNWCPGHWIGLLWLAWREATSDQDRKRAGLAARTYTQKAAWDQLRGSLFAGMNYRYAGFRAANISGDEQLDSIGYRGSKHVQSSFDETAAVVPVGDFGTRGLERHAKKADSTVAAVDAVYTAISLLWRAAAKSGDNRYSRVARRHTQTHLDWFCREDGSVWHKASFDPEAGTLQRQYNQLTRNADACWSRGLGWSVAGLVDAYNHTEKRAYLEAIERHIEYYRTNTPADEVPYAEMGPDVTSQYRDTSAAALVTYGLVRLHGSGSNVRRLREYGQRVLESLVDEYLVLEGPLRGQLRSGCYNAVDDTATEHELVWSTHYLLCALVAMDGDAAPLE